MPWYKITLTVEQIVSREHARLQDEFEKLFTSACVAGVYDMALFSDYKFMKTQNYYFSPSSYRFARHLIELYNGIPCEEPSPDIAGSLVGEAGYLEERKRAFNSKMTGK